MSVGVSIAKHMLMYVTDNLNTGFHGVASIGIGTKLCRPIQ